MRNKHNPSRKVRSKISADATGATEELTQDELADQLDGYSALISTQVRTVAFGILALTWVLLVQRSDDHVAVTVPRSPLLVIMLFCLLTLTSEFCQYLFAEKTVDEAFDRAVESPTGKAAYDAGTFSYRAQLVCYRLKLWLTFGAAGLLVLVLGKALLA
jgi:hypothetical protein